MKRCEICNKLSWDNGRCRDHPREKIKLTKRGPDKKKRKKKVIEKKYCCLCGYRHYSLGYCELHYRRLKKHGDPLFILKRGRKAL